MESEATTKMYYDRGLVDLESEAKQAYDRLKCAVSKFPAVPSKNKYLSDIESLYKSIDELVKKTRKITAAYRIAIWNLEKSNYGDREIDDDLIATVCRTILYHQFDIVVLKITPLSLETLESKLRPGLYPSKNTQDWLCLHNNETTGCVWNQSRIYCHQELIINILDLCDQLHLTFDNNTRKLCVELSDMLFFKNPEFKSQNSTRSEQFESKIISDQERHKKCFKHLPNSINLYSYET